MPCQAFTCVFFHVPALLKVWGEFDNPYLTLLPKYEAAQLGIFEASPAHYPRSGQTLHCAFALP